MRFLDVDQLSVEEINLLGDFIELVNAEGGDSKAVQEFLDAHREKQDLIAHCHYLVPSDEEVEAASAPLTEEEIPLFQEFLQILRTSEEDSDEESSFRRRHAGNDRLLSRCEIARILFRNAKKN